MKLLQINTYENVYVISLKKRLKLQFSYSSYYSFLYLYTVLHLDFYYLNV